MRGRLRLGGRAGLVLLAGVSLLLAGTSISSAAGQTATKTATSAAVVVKNNDFNGDGNSDVLSVDTAGRLWLYPGNGTGGWKSRIGYSYGWDAMTAILAPGDWDGDGHADLMSVDGSGYLRLYSSDGKGGWLSWKRFGSGWNTMTSVFGPGDFNGDGHMDLLARQNTGQLWLYPGDGKGGWLPRVGYGYGWNAMTSVRGPGDFDGDGFVDVTARDGSGNLWLYRGDGKGGWLAGRTQIGSSWQNLTAIVTPWDFSGDKKVDLLVRNASGQLYMYRGNGTGGWILPPVLVGTGWNSMTAITA